MQKRRQHDHGCISFDEHANNQKKDILLKFITLSDSIKTLMKGSIKELIEKLVKGVLFGSIEKTDEKTYKENDNE